MRTKSGIVTSAKMQNTVTVTVHRSVLHPIYGKRFRVTKKFLADTNGMTVNEGDAVVISECRPLSKRKYFKVTEITKKAPQLEEFKDDVAVEGGIQHDHRSATDGHDSRGSGKKAKDEDSVPSK
jgi:small subunit ribosomal protein S17